MRSLLALVVAVGFAQTPPTQTSVQSTRPFAGVTFINRIEHTPRPIHLRVVQVDLRTPGVRVKLSPPGGTREVVRQRTTEYVMSAHAQIGVNGHFFLPFPSSDADAWVIGFAASEGRVFSAFETPEQSYALVADAPALDIDQRNHATIVHRDPGQPDGRHVREDVEVWTAVAGSAQIVTNGKVTIPIYRDAEHTDGALTPGGPRNYSNTNSWYDVVTARTAVGISRDGGTLTLATVDARGDSEGMRVGEVATCLVADYGVWNALNLDGGGSTSLAMADPVTGIVSLANTSSDNPAGRIVATSLAVTAAPGSVAMKSAMFLAPAAGVPLIR